MRHSNASKQDFRISLAPWKALCTGCLLVVGSLLGIGFLGAAEFKAPATQAWPQFRGPDGQGHAPAGHVPAKWSESENVLWKTAIPGRGWSSPVISDGVCWLTTAVIKEATARQKEDILRTKLAGNPMAKQMEIIDSVSLRAVAVNLEDGQIVQDVELFHLRDPDPVHSLNSFASPTPVLDAGRLYCHFGTMGTACLDTATAKLVWKRRLPVAHSVGPGSSPALFENRLIIPCDWTDAQSIVALDTPHAAPV